MFRVDLPPDSSWKWETKQTPVCPDEHLSEIKYKIKSYETFIWEISNRMGKEGYSILEQKTLSSYIKNILLKHFPK